jgi:hypothetical protein
MRRWGDSCSDAEALDRAVRLHLMARYLEGLALHAGDSLLFSKAKTMRAEAEMFADIGLGHFAHDPPCCNFYPAR